LRDPIAAPLRGSSRVRSSRRDGFPGFLAARGTGVESIFMEPDKTPRRIVRSANHGDRHR